MTTWKPDYRRSTYLLVHFYLSIILSAILLGASMSFFLQDMSKEAFWSLAMGIVLIGSVPGVLVKTGDR